MALRGDWPDGEWPLPGGVGGSGGVAAGAVGVGPGDASGAAGRPAAASLAAVECGGAGIILGGAAWRGIGAWRERGGGVGAAVRPGAARGSGTPAAKCACDPSVAVAASTWLVGEDTANTALPSDEQRRSVNERGALCA